MQPKKILKTEHNILPLKLFVYFMGMIMIGGVGIICYSLLNIKSDFTGLAMAVDQNDIFILDDGDIRQKIIVFDKKTGTQKRIIELHKEDK